METLNAGGGGGAPAAASPYLQISSVFGSSSPAMSSSAAGANASPASSSSEISSHNAALAHDASSLFHSGRYVDCLNVLRQLLLTDHDNPKVLHNIAVAEYFQDGCTDPQKLLNVMSNIKRRIEEISKTAGEQLDGASALLTSSPSSTNSSSSKGNLAVSNAGTPTSYLENYDTSTANFNIAVILFHLQEFTAALSVVEPLYQNIEPIDESAALRICLLMLDITLASHQLRKACDVLQYMERAFGIGFLVTSSDTSSNVPPNSMVLPTTTESVSNLGNTAVALNSPRNSMVGEASLTRSSSEEVLDDDVLSLGFDMEGPNSAKPVTSLSMLAHTIGMSPDRPPSAPSRDPNVKIFLHLNKVRLYLSTRNIGAAKREIKLAMNLTQGGDMLTELMLNAHLEYSRGNHRKAVKLLMTCSGREPGLKHIIWNNLGCIHHYLRKDSTSYHYFMKALQLSTSPNGEKPLKISMFSQNRSLSILYNCGLQQLRGGNPILAARCFQEASSLYHKNPFLWLRLAECCISALEKGLLEADGYDNSSKRDELRVFSVGAGKWRKLFLPTGGLNPSLSTCYPGLKLEDKNGLPAFTSGYPTNGADFFVPGKSQKLNLVFARQCLHTAKHLLSRSMVRARKDTAEVGEPENDEDITGDVKHLASENGKGTALQPSSNGINKEGKINSTNTLLASVISFEEEQQKQNAAVLQYILADLSFVELCLDNPVGALKVSRELLQQSDCSKPFKFLGRVYAAESLCLMNRPSEAAIELSTCMTESNNVETLVNGSDEDGQKWKIGENSDASGEDDDVNSPTAGNVSSLTEALSISSLTGTRARVSLFVNLAMVHVMRGDVSQAHHFAMQAVSITPASPSAVLSVVYVNLLQGRTQEAVALLKHCRHLCVVSPR